MGWKDAIEVGARLLPALIEAVASLIKGGHSPEEAEAIVRRDIDSRAAQYERERAEDEDALDAKWGGEG